MLTYFMNPDCINHSRAGWVRTGKACPSPTLRFSFDPSQKQSKTTAASPVQDVPVGELLLSGVRRGVIVQVDELW